MEAIEVAQAASTRSEHRLESLYSLLARFSHLNAAPDIGSMNEDELNGLYRFLQRLAQEGE